MHCSETTSQLQEAGASTNNITFSLLSKHLQTLCKPPPAHDRNKRRHWAGDLLGIFDRPAAAVPNAPVNGDEAAPLLRLVRIFPLVPQGH